MSGHHADVFTRHFDERRTWMAIDIAALPQVYVFERIRSEDMHVLWAQSDDDSGGDVIYTSISITDNEMLSKGISWIGRLQCKT